MLSPLLTSSESNVLQDAQFFITKTAIDAKINDLFAVLKNKIEAVNGSAAGFPPELSASPGRMHRGEHLGPLPWRALDCPRAFSGQDIFVFRTLLIWGREFSFHLLLGGKWMASLGPLLDRGDLAADGWRLSRQESPWDWTLDNQSHLPMADLSPGDWQANLQGSNWLKLSQSLPLEAFSQVPEAGTRLWTNLLKSFQ